MGPLRGLVAVTVLALVTVVAGCVPSVAPSPTAEPSRSSVAPAPTPSPIADVDPTAALSLEQKVGQLFMVGTDVQSASPATITAITDRHAGSIFLHGRTTAGADAVAALVGQFTALAPASTARGNAPDGSGPTGGVRLWVATDQEGGEVQVLRGPGFSDMPYAIRQADLPADQLQAQATQWGAELAAAGVDMNLAPVADIVTSHDARFSNPPIGALGRQYGYDAPTVEAGAGAFAAGMRASGILPVFKHFPGLGHVTANTDTTANVHDATVAADGPDVGVYRPLTAAGASAVMVSTAIYDNIDASAPAVFSPRVVSLVRSDVGFDGVIMSDDLSAAAAAQAWAPGDRAVLAVTAGVDLVLVSADPTVYAAMYDAVLAKAQNDPAFAARVDEAAARVVTAKLARP
ncbi:glycoside hydrolase family 3 N-terminal domain-containing protein [Microbacterium sp. bgisy203]|uniref:glycoside hydrolase family 3 N-terminal domain-containing protein n=1 Tax=Microbacterium sp. bgisy203 TaxID=3413799 RepID=UPI003D74E80C